MNEEQAELLLTYVKTIRDIVSMSFSVMIGWFLLGPLFMWIWGL